MPNINQKLDRFTATILSAASEETERSMQEMRALRDAALQDAEDKVLLEAYQYIHSEVGRIKGESGRLVSRRMLDNKRALALRREEIAQEVLGLVGKKIAAFTATPAYRDRLEGLLREALERLDGAADLQLFLRPDDMALAERLRPLLPAGSTLVPATFRMGGLIAQSQQLGLRVDSSFDSEAQALSGHFAELFGLSLSDDDAEGVVHP